MRFVAGTRAPTFQLPALDGSTFDLATLRGTPFLLSFYRFASCPFCNLRLHRLISRYDELRDRITAVAVFDSPLDDLRRHAERHEAPFPILADPGNTAYRAYGIEHSFAGVLKAVVFRMPTLLHAMFGKGYLPLRMTGSLTTMPADFLVDGDGIIRVAHYGRDEGDHLPLDVIVGFAKEGGAGRNR